jgi:hypothetical protein
MRCLALLAALLPAPAAAWDFSPLPICTISEETDQGGVRVTFDPATGLYAIRLVRAAGWPAAPVFTIRFDGTPLAISTNRHTVAGDTVTVTDTGFGNVLAGFATANGATVMLGDTTLALPTTGAADAVAAFRACPTPGLA